jgi:hypothetical protein
LNLTNPQTLARMDKLTWILIFVGLFVLALGIASHRETPAGGWTLSVMGAIAMAIGVVLVYLRSRIPEAPAPGAQSTSPTEET